MLHSPIDRIRRLQTIERRVSERHAVNIPTIMIDVTEEAEEIVIQNISTHGLLARAPGKFQIGSDVQIYLPNIGAKDATIRWNGNGAIGFEFADQIDEASFSALLDDLPDAA